MITERIDSISRIPAEYMKVDPPAPRSIKIELTSKCNFRCNYCGLITRNGTPTKDMEWDLFERIIDEAVNAGVSEVGLFYIGEPFASPYLLEKAIFYCKQVANVPYVFVTSNASIARSNHVEKCMSYGLDSLKWSCNTHDADTFQSTMNVSPKLFESAKRNIEGAYRLRDIFGYKTKLYASSIMFDEEQPKRMKPFLEKSILPYVDEHYWLPLMNHGYVFEDGKTTPGNTGRFENPVDPLPCWAVFTIAHVMVDGKMTACCFDSKGDWVVGDLKEQSFMEAWHGSQFQHLRERHLAKDVASTQCNKCVVRG